MYALDVYRLFNALPQPYIVFKPDNNRFLFNSANSAFYNFSGLDFITPDLELNQFWRQFEPSISHTDISIIQASFQYAITQKVSHCIRTISIPYLEIESCPILSAETEVEFIVQTVKPFSKSESNALFNRSFPDKELEILMSFINSGTLISAFDKEGKVISVNDNVSSVLGGKRENLIGKDFLSTCANEHDKEDFSHIWSVIHSGKIWKGELCHRTQMGKMHWLETSIVPVLDESQKPYRFLSIQIDITRAKQADMTLSDSEHKYRLLFSRSPIPMWVYDLDTLKIEDVNDAAEQKYGYSKSEFLNLNLKDLRPKEDYSILESAVNNIRTTEKFPEPIMVRHLKKNGEMLYVKIHSREIEIQMKRKRVVWAYDQTEKEIKLKQLSKIYQQFETIGDISNFGYWTFDFNAHKLEWYFRIFDIFEEDKEKYIPKIEKFEAMFHQDDRHYFKNCFKLRLKEKSEYSFEARIKTIKGTSKWVFMKVRTFFNESDKIARLEAICFDITSRKEQEFQLNRKNELQLALNNFMRILLFRQENWERVLQKAFHLVSKTLNIKSISFFEYDYIDDKVDYSHVNHKLDWNSYSEKLFIEKTDYQQIHLSMDRAFLSSTFSGESMNVGQMKESKLKSFLELNEINDFFVQKVTFNYKTYGFIIFQAPEEIIKEDIQVFLKSITSAFSMIWNYRKISEEVYLKNEQLKSVINNVPGVIYRCMNRSHRAMVFFGEGIMKITGYTVEEHMRNPAYAYSKLIHPDDLSMLNQALNAIEEKSSFDVQYRILHSSGRYIWVRDRGNGVFDQNNLLVWIDGVIVDISDSKQIEFTLKENNERLQIIMKATHDAVIDWDIKNDTTIWGEGFHEVFGYMPDSYHNHLWSDNIHPEDKERILTSLKNALADPSVKDFRATFNFYRADGSIVHVSHKGIIIRDSLGQATRAIGSLTDISDLVSYTKKVESQNELLKELTWTQSHLIRGPLAA